MVAGFFAVVACLVTAGQALYTRDQRNDSSHSPVEQRSNDRHVHDLLQATWPLPIQLVHAT